MTKKQTRHHTGKLFGIFALIGIVISPFEIFAQSSEGQSPWTGRESEEIRQWRERSNLLSQNISKLDANKVLNIPIPILFGILPENLTRNFGDPRSAGRAHEGLDIMAPLRAPIVSPTAAVVLRTGVGENAGNYVYTANPGGETFAYLHLDEIAPNLKEGDELPKGALIGYVGNTGNASGGATHLHFEIRADGNGTDPYPRLASVFTLPEKIEYLKNILDTATDEKKLAEHMVLLYRKELAAAQTLAIPLPTSITEALVNKIIMETPPITRTLRVGSRGNDVKILQSVLKISTDGAFGPKTKAAVVAFQISKSLVADGIVGPKTRAALGV